MNAPVTRAPVRRAAAPAAGRPARQAAAQAPANQIFSEARLLPSTIVQFTGTIKVVSDKVVQMLVKQRGGQLRQQDFPADKVLAIVQDSSEPNADIIYFESAAGLTLGKLMPTDYEGAYAVFTDQKGRRVSVNSSKALIQSDKQQPEAWGVNTGSRSSAATGAPRGRRAAAPAT